ncbi:MAG: general stress protein [Scytonema sp. PMC 1070.18]|nr:general stress protein [Scytonema sp. PMC 1070.18]
MAFTQLKSAIGVFSNRKEADLALRQLMNAGFSLENVSIIAQDTEDLNNVHEKDYGKGAKAGAITGGAIGGLTGLFQGLAILTIPGVGPALAVGTILASTVLAGGIGTAAGGLMGGLIGWGVPEEDARFYNDRLSYGDYLVIIEGTENEILRAEAILNSKGVQHWRVYDTPRKSSHP